MLLDLHVVFILQKSHILFAYTVNFILWNIKKKKICFWSQLIKHFLYIIIRLANAMMCYQLVFLWSETDITQFDIQFCTLCKLDTVA